MRALIITLVVAAIVAGGFTARKRAAASASEPISSDMVATAETRRIDLAIDVSGDVTPAFQLEVKPEVGGKIKALHVTAGQQITKGAPLVEIDDADLLIEKASVATEIDGARLSVDKAERNFERAKELFDAKLISREVFDNLTTEHSLAQNSLVRAERKLQTVDDRLRRTVISSPMDGTILNVSVMEGQVVVAAASVNSGTALMVIADLSRLVVDSHINQVDVASVSLDQRVALSTESLKEVKMDALISFIAPVATVKNNTKGFQVQALIENPDGRLRPGMTVNMRIPIASAPAVVSVPLSAVFKDEDAADVVYVRRGGLTEKRRVELGLANFNFVEIKSGLTPGEEILLVQPSKLEKKS